MKWSNRMKKTGKKVLKNYFKESLAEAGMSPIYDLKIVNGPEGQK